MTPGAEFVHVIHGSHVQGHQWDQGLTMWNIPGIMGGKLK